MSSERTAYDDYQLLARVRLTRAVATRLALASAVTFLASAYALWMGVTLLRGESLQPITVSSGATSEPLVWVVAFVALVLVVLVPHELLHGLVMARYGQRPAFGVDSAHVVFPYAYANTDGSFGRNQMLVLLLAPLIVITLVGAAVLVIYPAPIVIVALAVNAAGSVGDSWMAATVSRYPASVRVARLPDGERGVGIYAPETSESATRFDALAGPLSRILTGALGTTVALVGGLTALVLASLATGSGTVVIADPLGRDVLFRHEYTPATGVTTLELSVRYLLVLATAGGLLWAFLIRCRGHRSE